MSAHDVEFVRPQRERARTRRWVQGAGAHLLVVDPRSDGARFDEDMAARGVHVTRVDSTLDALVEFGRGNPAAVIVSQEASGLPAPDFVKKVLEYGSPLMIAVGEEGDSGSIGCLLLAGATTALVRPYTAEVVWNLLHQSANPLDDHARLSYGPIVLDARAFTVHIRGSRIPDLPLKEFEMLRALMYRAPEVVTNEELRVDVWGTTDEAAGDGTIRVHVRRLRARLEGAAEIRSVRRRGYALTVD